MRGSIRPLSFLRRTLFKAFILTSTTATAAIPPLLPLRPQPSQFETTSTAPLQELDLKRLAQLEKLFHPEGYMDPAAYIPLNELHNKMDGEDVAMRILKKSLNRWLAANPTLEQKIGAQKMVKGIEFGADTSNAVKHKLSLKLNPFSTQAKLSYRGAAVTDLTYDIDDSVLRFELSKQVGRTTYVASHNEHAGETADVLGLRWSF